MVFILTQFRPSVLIWFKGLPFRLIFSGAGRCPQTRVQLLTDNEGLRKERVCISRLAVLVWVLV